MDLVSEINVYIIIIEFTIVLCRWGGGDLLQNIVYV